ncbi:MAG: PaaI family thioesterase [Syntrophomonas sp.]
MKAENRGINEELFEVIRNAYDSQPCHQSMGITITYLGKGTAGLTMTPNTNLSTGGGRIHGGVLATMIDVAMGAAAATIGRLYRTAELKLNYIAPAFETDLLIVEGRVVHPGKTLAVTEANLLNGEGKLIAKGMGTFFSDYKLPPPEV